MTEKQLGKKKMKERTAVIERFTDRFLDRQLSPVYATILCMLTYMLKYTYVYFKSLQVINAC